MGKKPATPRDVLAALNRHRLKRGLSVYRVAKDTGMSQTQVAKIFQTLTRDGKEIGHKGDLRVGTLLTLAHAVGLDVELVAKE